jgi:hypothetical protein
VILSKVDVGGFLTSATRTGPVNRSKTALAKLILIFFAVLFTAVLIHPDVDLLDVHDVKITSARSQIRHLDGFFSQQAPFLLGSTVVPQDHFVPFLYSGSNPNTSIDQDSSGILRI